MGRQEFLVPPNVLALVYSQTVVWTGALFSPLLPLINTIKFILFFYCKKVNTVLLLRGLCILYAHVLHSSFLSCHALVWSEKLKNCCICLCVLVSDNFVSELSTRSENISIHQLQLLLPLGSALRMDIGQRGSYLQCS